MDGILSSKITEIHPSRILSHRMRWALLFLTLPLFGAYVGNPASPGIMNQGFFSARSPLFKFTSGYLADYISNKRYVSSRQTTMLDPNPPFRHFGLHSQMASASLILIERFELFGMAGGTKEHPEWRKSVTWSDWSTVLVDFQSSYHFSWSTGAKVILLQWGQTYFSTDFTYFAIPKSHKSYFRFLNRLNLPLETKDQSFAINEWQMSLGLSSKFWFLTPYGGMTYLHSRLKIRAGAEVPALYYKNEEKYGYFYGLTLSVTGRMHLNFERRVRDEFAYSAALVAVF